MSEQIESVPAAFICRCEELTLDDLRAAIAAGARTINDVKRRTRAGMGICQGVYCLNHVAGLVQAELDQPRELVVPMTSRPPARVLTLTSLANLAERE